MRKDIEKARAAWNHRGQIRPDFAVKPGPGEESVWDYPRPPVVVPDERHVVVRLEGAVIADTRNAVRVLETASPPVFYIPFADTKTQSLKAEPQHTFCEWKGQAHYFSVCTNSGGKRKNCVHNAAWCYPEPFAGFEAIRECVAFYPSLVECYVDNVRVRAQQGGFYGGWVTDEITGPYKGEPGTAGW